MAKLCSASSQPHNVTAKSVKPQQRQLLFFNTVEVKLVKKKKKKYDLKTNKPLLNSTLQSPIFYFLFFFFHKKVPSSLHHPNFLWRWQREMDNF